MSGPDFLAWRVSFQSEEHATRAAFAKANELAAQLARAKAQLQAIATAKRSNFEDSIEYQDWAASMAARTLAELASPPKAITRGPGACLGCKAPMSAAHEVDCFFAPFVTGTPP